MMIWVFRLLRTRCTRWQCASRVLARPGRDVGHEEAPVAILVLRVLYPSRSIMGLVRVYVFFMVFQVFVFRV